jgi:hypothetical protein
MSRSIDARDVRRLKLDELPNFGSTKVSAPVDKKTVSVSTPNNAPMVIKIWTAGSIDKKSETIDGHGRNEPSSDQHGRNSCRQWARVR